MNYIVIPIFYWGGTNVSWLQLEFALHFLRDGVNIFFIYDRQFDFKFSFLIHNFLIRRVIQKFVKYQNVEILEYDILNPIDISDKYDQAAKNKDCRSTLLNKL